MVAKYELLSLGLKFIKSPSSSLFATGTFIQDFEVCNNHWVSLHLTDLSKGSLSVMQGVCTSIKDQFAHVKPHYVPPNLSPCLYNALKSIKEDESIIISKADKGNVNVIMDVEQYLSLSHQHLSDGKVYKVLKHDPTPEIIACFNAYLKGGFKTES